MRALLILPRLAPGATAFCPLRGLAGRVLLSLSQSYGGMAVECVLVVVIVVSAGGVADAFVF